MTDINVRTIFTILVFLSVFSLLSVSYIKNFKIVNTINRPYGNRNFKFERISSKNVIVSPSLSLDRALVPSTNSGGSLIISMTLITLALFATSFSWMIRYIEETVLGATLRINLTKFQKKLIDLLSSSYITKIFKSLQFLPRINPLIVSKSTATLSEWKTCKLKKQHQINNDLSIYRFYCDKPFSSSDLSLGQQVTLCCTDSNGRVLKDNFFPFSFSKGTFDVLGASTSNNILEQLDIDDEIAFKKSKVQLKYIVEDENEGGKRRGDNVSPVDSVSIITSGQGVAPTLQIVNRILTDPESAVESIDILWINEKKEDFVLNDVMEDLEDKFTEKLFIARVVDRQFADPDSQVNDKLREAMVPYRNGRMAMIIIPETMQSKSCRMLESLGYPLDTSVLAIAV